MSEASAISSAPRGNLQCLAAAGLGCALLLAAQPPLSWWPLAWLAPLPWVWLIGRHRLPGRRPYFEMWLAGIAYWLIALRWIPMAHPLQYFSWCFLGLYLSIYLPLMVKLARLGVHRFGWPLWLASPVAWVACEYTIYHLFTGIALATLPATQIHWRSALQCIDLAGPYTLGFVMLLVAGAVVTSCDRTRPSSSRLLAATMGGVALAGTIVYGQVRLAQLAAFDSSTTATPLRIAIVQGNEPAVWEADADRDKRVMRDYVKLTRDAVAAARARGDAFDLIVWPENMFRCELWSFDADFAAPSEWGMTTAELEAFGREQLAIMARDTEANLLVGIDRSHGSTRGGEPHYTYHNAAAVVDRAGQLVDVYDKSHLVPCGEYLPLAWLFPVLYDVTPMAMGLTPGEEPIAPLVAGARLCPNICYESVMTYVVRQQVATLAARGERPTLLANLTNDSWFRDSCELDMHLACTILRAVECRTPTIVAANGGLSAAIDTTGKVLAVTQKMTPQVLTIDILPQAGNSLYLTIDEWPALVCVAICVAWTIHARLTRQRQPAHYDPQLPASDL